MATPTSPGFNSVLPAILFEIDDSIADLIQSDETVSPETGDVLFYGRSLAFDWSTLRFRIGPQGDPAIVDGHGALLESVVKALMTPRYVVPIYGNDYGAEFHEIQGEPVPIALAQVERIVRETVLDDPRAVAIESFQANHLGNGALHVTFRVRTYDDELLTVPSFTVRVSADG